MGKILHRINIFLIRKVIENKLSLNFPMNKFRLLDLITISNVNVKNFILQSVEL